jgi:hypothetical protein
MPTRSATVSFLTWCGCYLQVILSVGRTPERLHSVHVQPDGHTAAAGFGAATSNHRATRLQVVMVQDLLHPRHANRARCRCQIAAG